ncbi:Tube1 [Symbiodinium necroappetens]|uniref:Tube1 protein n=1 Tax=Symbiodinium necroappetens TaxID=1628268 RepID=A0A812K3B4_9DINO|nr:Tube1 [Symbiodinium necroappetens]
MPREVLTIQVGQCGNQIGCRFWDLVLREHAFVSKTAVYDAALSSFFRNVDTRHANLPSLPVGDQIRTLKARCLLVDMEEGVVNSLLTGPLADLFDARQRITDVSGAGNNWAHGYHVYGPTYRESIEEKVRKAAEQCDSLQCFLLLHSLGGGTGSGLGTYILEALEDYMPEVFRFVSCVCPSRDDDVVTSPYNTILAMRPLIEAAHCVLPTSNDALAGICNQISARDAGEDAAQATLIDLPQDERQGGRRPPRPSRTSRTASAPPRKRDAEAVVEAAMLHEAPVPRSAGERRPRSAGAERPFDRMNSLVAHLLNNLTSSMRFEGSLNLDLNEITMNLVPFPRMHFLLASMSPLYFGKDPRLVSRGFHQMFSDVVTQGHQLMNVDPRGSTYMALAFLVRGSASIADVNRNIGQLRKKLKLLPFNEDAFKIGLCKVAPRGLPYSVLHLGNTCAAHQMFSHTASWHQYCMDKKHAREKRSRGFHGPMRCAAIEVKNFSRLYSRKAHVHHYTNFMEREEFDQAFETVNSLIKDYIHLDMLQPGCRKSALSRSCCTQLSLHAAGAIFLGFGNRISSDGEVLRPADKRPIPSIRFELLTADGGMFSFVLEPKDFAEVKGTDCVFAFQPVDLPPNLGPMWVFGQTALRKYYTVYDAKRWQVGVGLARHSAQKRTGSLVQDGASAQKKTEPEVCEDDNKNMVWNHLPGCKSFASMGYCHRFPPLARKYCRLSCALCTAATSVKTSPADLIEEKDLQESSPAPVQVAGSGMRLSGARRGVVKLRTLGTDET